MSGSKLWVFYLQYWGGGMIVKVTSAAPEGRLDPCNSKGKFWGLPPGVLSPGNWFLPGEAG